MAPEGRACYFGVRVQGWAPARPSHEPVPILHLTTSSGRHSFPPGSLPSLGARPAFPAGRVLHLQVQSGHSLSASLALRSGPLETFLAIRG